MGYENLNNPDEALRVNVPLIWATLLHVNGAIAVELPNLRLLVQCYYNVTDVNGLL